MNDVASGQLSGLGVLRQRRDFAWIWLGQVVSRFGDALDLIAFMWIILELTGSSLVMGTLVVVNVLPSILIGPFAGVLVDRWSRKRVMIVADVGRGLVTLTLAALWFLGVLPVWALFAATFVNSVFEVFALPARRAVVPLLVGKENLVPANAIYSFGENLASLFGLVAAGVVVASAGILAAIVADAVTFLFSALTVVVASVPELERDRSTLRVRAFLQELREGLAFVGSEKVILFSIIMAAVTNFALGPLEALLPIFVGQDLGLGPDRLSWAYAGLTVGSLIGASLVAQIFKGVAEVRLLRVGMVGIGMAYTVLGLAPSYGALIGIMGAMGLMLPFAQTGLGSLIQRYTPADRMGRVGALNSTLVLAAMPLSAGLAGSVAEWVPIPWVFGSLGVVALVAAISILWSGPFRELRRRGASPGGGTSLSQEGTGR